MAKKELTDRFLKSIKPAKPGKRVIHMDTREPQLGVRVTEKSTPANVGSFVLVARFPSSPNPTARRIGDYPDMSLSEAREKAREWRALISKGIDPKTAAEAAKRAEERKRLDTFGAAWLVYAEERLSQLKSGPAVRRMVEHYALPTWGSIPLTELGPDDWQRIKGEATKKMPLAGANRLYANLRAFFRWRADNGHFNEPDPLARVKRPLKEKPRQRTLEPDEIRAVARAADLVGYPFGDLTRMLLLTGQRLREVAEAKWSEIDLAAKLWTIPETRMKGDAAHKIPLAEAVIDLLGALPVGERGPYIFSSTGGATPISGFSFGKRKIDAAAKIGKGWRFHDLRRTFRTGLGDLTVPTNVAELCIAHRQVGIHRVYDTGAYLPERRRAMELWARAIITMSDPGGASNVVNLRQDHSEPREFATS
ncbi:site-specific integrase [Methylocapsa palsarum]|uniref:Integrase n=1 Tax=Methylocapsa palsarum TaxID=1612308 RepID=A0A1I3XRQ1_9HYPH|nr:site-specific integrase [Methylocapsa palsarum]SFK22009.1 Integrase [Methylocapsa palsarum]